MKNWLCGGEVWRGSRTEVGGNWIAIGGGDHRHDEDGPKGGELGQQPAAVSTAFAASPTNPLRKFRPIRCSAFAWPMTARPPSTGTGRV